ncbi:sigma-54 interaction domain-containing protein [Cytobacillus dafuensis]|uniref:PAS domain-containing protein n=1 Tax=Cytobacillus dafuensis TaxID=1742359 RepID=A0A5B8Z818_CYTDA|nr:sigma 54-interacting transcriptional regulator [Cytobacillus dafuensis]QED49097.1 PAS domain-containing protein [Cytobacillus dafuensis]
MFSLPTLKKIIENKLITLSCEEEISEKNGEYFLGLSKVPSTIVCMDDSFDTLVQLAQAYPTVIVLDVNKKPLGCITAAQIIHFLHNSYHQLKAFYETVIRTMDASVTVIDANERVRTWTEGAEKIFSVKQNEIIGKPITDFFEHKDLEILQTLYKGKKISGQHHQPRSDLFVLINSNPVYFNDQIIGAVVSETDITNQVVLNEKLFNMSTEVHRLEQEVARYKPSVDPFNLIKGNSAALQRTVQLAKKVCSVKSTVLILGESGVGKEVFAKAIHEASEVANAPFISINCGAIPASLFESEFFGYERGAFSGADQKGKKGKIELAKGGTLFLDEIGELPLEMQVKLLRVLQERKFYRVGGEKEIDTDFRVIAATNRNLKDLMNEGQFREDLYYRLNVVSIHIPPLRERREDIIELTHYFLNDFSMLYQRPIHQFSQEVMQEMLRYDWPGNIRELRNVVERLVVFATDGAIRKEYLPFHSNSIDNENNKLTSHYDSNEMDYNILPLQEEMDQHEKRVLEKALQIANGNKLECAKKLGITRATLYNRLKRLGIH